MHFRGPWQWVSNRRTKLLYSIAAVSLFYYFGIFTVGRYQRGSKESRLFQNIEAEVDVEEFSKSAQATTKNGVAMAHIVCFNNQFPLAANFYLSSVEALGLKNSSLFIFFNVKNYKSAISLGIPSYLYKSTVHHNIDLKADKVADKSVYRHLVTYDLLLSGVANVLTTDADMYWYKNPLPEIRSTCADCDVIVQHEEPLDVNLGIVFVRNTNATIKFYRDLVTVINRRGIDRCRTVFHDVLSNTRGDLRIGYLESSKFPDGPRYFESATKGRDGKLMCPDCVAVNDNHLVGTEAKIFRLQEHRMWLLEKNRYYSNPHAKYMTYDNVVASSADSEHTDVAALKAALGVAMATGRILILPPYFQTQSGLTPLNGLFSIQEFHSAFKEFYRESTFLENALVPEKIRNSICGSDLTDLLIETSNANHTSDASSHGVTAENILHLFSEQKLHSCPVVKFHSFYMDFRGFNSKKDNLTYFELLKHGFIKASYRQQESLERSPFLIDTESNSDSSLIEERRYVYDGEFMERIITPSSVVLEDKFTVMMPFFNRKSTLTDILTHYLEMEKVDKIVLLWYKALEDMPMAEELVPVETLNSKLLVKHMREDNLMIRFILFPEVKTKAILSCDDDLIVYKEDLYRMFEKWKKHPHGIVGPFMRLAYRESPGYYKYIWNPKHNYNIVLTNVAFFHRDWVPVLERDLPRSINDTVREWTNCEDIAFNFLVTSHCKGQAVFYVKPKKKPNHFSQLTKSLSGRKSHALQRDLCVSNFVEAYGDANPLQTFKVAD